MVGLAAIFGRPNLDTGTLCEMFYNTVMGLLSFLLWYFPMGLYRNARETNTEHSRGVTIFLFVWVFFIYTTSFAFLCIVGLQSAEVAGGIVGLLTIMMFIFCGVIAGPGTMPGFWIFMYRANPFTYFVEGFLGTALANAKATCSDNEWMSFETPAGMTCETFMEPYMSMAGGYLQDPNSTGSCNFCQLAETNTFLNGVNIQYANRWRNFGLMWVFVVFNIALAIFIFWLARVPKVKKEARTPTKKVQK